MSYCILLVFKLCLNNLPAKVCRHVFIFLTTTVENQKMLVSGQVGAVGRYTCHGSECSSFSSKLKEW